jgi:hypothetical protein
MSRPPSPPLIPSGSSRCVGLGRPTTGTLGVAMSGHGDQRVSGEASGLGAVVLGVAADHGAVGLAAAAGLGLGEARLGRPATIGVCLITRCMPVRCYGHPII